MEIESKYVALEPGPFAALMQAPAVGGFLLEPMAPFSVRDRYLDTSRFDLLREALAFRLREQNGSVLATLKDFGEREDGIFRRGETEETVSLGAELNGEVIDPARLPEGPLREAAIRAAGGARLEEMLTLRQYRTPRAVYADDRLIGVLSLDVVAYEAKGKLHVTNEVELEISEGGTPADLANIDPDLRAMGLSPLSRSKFERALIRLAQHDDAPLLLLPDERRTLTQIADHAPENLARRACAVLHASEGREVADISDRCGGTGQQVRHWLAEFRSHRMSVFGMASSEDLASAQVEPAGYRVSEVLISDIENGPDAFEDATESREPDANQEIQVEPEASNESEEFRPSAAAFTFFGEEDDEEEEPFGEWPDLPTQAEPEPDARPEPDDEPELGLDELLDGLVAPPPTETPVFFDSPEPQKADSAEGSAPESGVATARSRPIPVSPLRKTTSPLPEFPSLQPDEPALSAASTVLRYAHERLVHAVDEAASDPDEDGVRRLTAAAHRVRIALEMFADEVPAEAALQLTGSLARLARQAEIVTDLHQISLHLQETQSDVSLEAIENRQQAESARLIATLTSEPQRAALRRQAYFVSRLERQAAASLPFHDERRLLDDGPPRPSQRVVREALPTILWKLFRDVEGYGRDALEMRSGMEGVEALGTLAVACGAFRFGLALARDAAHVGLKSLADPFGELEAAALSLRHHALGASIVTYEYEDDLRDGLSQLDEAIAVAAGAASRERLGLVTGTL
ncbi:hypothetical protein BH23BAC4_BH23BAC4_03780 [soil metagenome]